MGRATHSVATAVINCTDHADNFARIFGLTAGHDRATRPGERGRCGAASV